MNADASVFNRQDGMANLVPIYISAELLQQKNAGKSNVVIASGASPQASLQSNKQEPRVADYNAKFFDRIASDLDARFSKPELKSKAEKAANDFMDAMAPDSKTDAAAAVCGFEASMQEISDRMEKFKTSSLFSGINDDITASLEKMAAKKYANKNLVINPAAIEKIRTILEIAKKTSREQDGSAHSPACRTVATQVLGIFQEKLFEHFKSDAITFTGNFLCAMDPTSGKSIEFAAIKFNDGMKFIFAQRDQLCENYHGDLFTSKIKESILMEGNKYFSEAKNKHNKADWMARMEILKKASAIASSKPLPKDIVSAGSLSDSIMNVMQDYEFTGQIRTGIKTVLSSRYEQLIWERSPSNDLAIATENLINELKECLNEKCEGRNASQIAEKIHSCKDVFTTLLMNRDNVRYRENLPNDFKIAVEDYLKSNHTELDLAVSAMVLDHLNDMRRRGLLIRT